MHLRPCQTFQLPSPPTCLVDISEVLVLQISLIKQAPLPRLLLIPRHMLLLPGPIAPPKKRPKSGQRNHLRSNTEEHHADTKRIQRRLLGLEEEGTDEVSKAVADEEHRVGSNLLGVTGCVGCGDGHAEGPAGGIGERDPETGETAVGVSVGDEVEAQNAGEEGDEAHEHDGDSSVSESGGAPAR